MHTARDFCYAISIGLSAVFVLHRQSFFFRGLAFGYDLCRRSAHLLRANCEVGLILSGLNPRLKTPYPFIFFEIHACTLFLSLRLSGTHFSLRISGSMPSPCSCSYSGCGEALLAGSRGSASALVTPQTTQSSFGFFFSIFLPALFIRRSSKSSCGCLFVLLLRRQRFFFLALILYEAQFFRLILFLI